MFLPILPPEPAPWKLYRAQYVALNLLDGTEIRDARSDLRAVGWTYSRGPDDYHGSQFVIIGGRASTDNGSEAVWSLTVLALLGRQEFVLAVRAEGSRSQRVFRRGRLQGGRIVPGAIVAKPPRTARRVPSTARESIALTGEWLPYGSWKALGMPEKAIIEWARLRPPAPGVSAKVGQVSGSIDTQPIFFTDPNQDRHPQWKPTWVAMLRANGRLSTLADRTERHSGSDFGDVLFVSPEGWMIVTVGERALAWLHPIRRR